MTLVAQSEDVCRVGMQDPSGRVGISLLPGSPGRLPTGAGGTGKPTEGGTSIRRDSPLRTCHSQSNNINSIIVKTPQSRDGDYFFETLSFEALGKFTC